MACSSCKSNRPINRVKWGVLILGSYIVFSSVYGTIEIFKIIIEFFK